MCEGGGGGGGGGGAGASPTVKSAMQPNTIEKKEDTLVRGTAACKDASSYVWSGLSGLMAQLARPIGGTAQSSALREEELGFLG